MRRLADAVSNFEKGISMSDVPEELKYSKSHEWVRVEGDLAFIGITQHAEHLLGDIVYVELPEEGDTIQQGEEFGVIESVKAASDLYAPVSGEVMAVNQELEDTPASVNQSPYGDGWLIQVKLADDSELSTLMTAEEYAGLTAEEE